MKNKIYLFGVIATIILMAGCIFKTSHWTGAGVLLCLGFFLYVIVFMPAALFSSFKTESNKKLKALYIIAYICVVVVCASALLKLQKWPGDRIFMLISIPIPFILFLPAYLWSIRKNKQLNYNNLILVMFFFAYFAGMTALLALNVSRDMIEEYIISANNYEEQSNLANEQTQAIINSLSINCKNDSIKKQSILTINQNARLVTQLIDKIKTGIIKNVGDNDQAIDSKGNYNLWKIKGADNKTISSNPIFTNKMNELKAKLSGLNQVLLATLNPKESELKNYINHFIDLSNKCEDVKLVGTPVIAIIDYLNSIRCNVESVSLEAIINIDSGN